MFEAISWNADSLSNTNFQKTNNVLSSSVRSIYTFKMPNGERIKVDRKGISPGRIS